MRKRLVHLRGSHNRALRRRGKKAKDAAYRIRCLIVTRLAEGASTGEVERSLDVARATAVRVAQRFNAEGFAGLVDHRMYNGRSKLRPEHLQRLEQLIDCVPSDFGWKRPTWTREVLALQLEADTGLKLSVSHIGRLLRAVGARWKRGRPVVVCPWPRRKRLLRFAALKRLVRELPTGEVVFYVDEVDIHLNPKIGPDWMRRGQQRRVVTPGINKKHYVAGALDAHSGRLLWVDADSKNSDLFIALVDDIARRYRGRKRIHLILDNYSIHSSKKSQRAVDAHGGKVVLHFLPPYGQQANRIERVWGEVHANVTRNHRRETIDDLVADVNDALVALSPFPGSCASLRRAA